MASLKNMVSSLLKPFGKSRKHRRSRSMKAVASRRRNRRRHHSRRRGMRGG